MLYALCEWEVNGYSDSDWYAVVYDDEHNKLFVKEIGTTRFANAMPSLSANNLNLPTKDIVEKARLLLVPIILEYLKREEKLKFFPDNFSIGDSVVSIEDHRNVEKNISNCAKCSGSGKWINPKNQQDIRSCFYCHGAGVIKGEKVKINGKQKYVLISQGAVGVVIDVFAFGTFYVNGYNKPDRSNRTASVKLVNGNVVNIPLSKLKLNSKELTEEQLLTKAINLSYNYDFGKFCHDRFTWYDKNYASNVVNGDL